MAVVELVRLSINTSGHYNYERYLYNMYELIRIIIFYVYLSYCDAQ